MKGSFTCVLTKGSDAILDVQLVGTPVLRPADSPVNRLVGRWRVAGREIEDLGNVVVETDINGPPLRKSGSGYLVLPAYFLFGSYLLRPDSASNALS